MTQYYEFMTQTKPSIFLSLENLGKGDVWIIYLNSTNFEDWLWKYIRTQRILTPFTPSMEKVEPVACN
jgi:hypothetical protein